MYCFFLRDIEVNVFKKYFFNRYQLMKYVKHAIYLSLFKYFLRQCSTRTVKVIFFLFFRWWTLENVIVVKFWDMTRFKDPLKRRGTEKVDTKKYSTKYKKISAPKMPTKIQNSFLKRAQMPHFHNNGFQMRQFEMVFHWNHLIERNLNNQKLLSKRFNI